MLIIDWIVSILFPTPAPAPECVPEPPFDGCFPADWIGM